VPDDHTASTCPDDFPSADNYKPLTLDFANKLREQRASKLFKTNGTSKPAAAGVTTSLPSSSTISEVDSLGDLDFVASIFGPLAGLLVIGNASFLMEISP